MIVTLSCIERQQQILSLYLLLSHLNPHNPMLLVLLYLRVIHGGDLFLTLFRYKPFSFFTFMF